MALQNNTDLLPLCLTFFIVIIAHVFYSKSELNHVQSKFFELTQYKLNQLAEELKIASLTANNGAIDKALILSPADRKGNLAGNPTLQANFTKLINKIFDNFIITQASLSKRFTKFRDTTYC